MSLTPLLAHYRVHALLGENLIASDGSITESVYWSKEEISRYVSDSYREIARETKALEEIFPITTTADVAEYTLSSQILQLIRVSYDNRKIDNTTKWELDRTEHDWENQVGYVSHYVTSQQRNRRIRLYKAPEESAGTTFAGEGEYGVVIDIDDGGTNTFMFSTDLGVTADTDGGDWTSTFSSELGEIVYIPSSENNLEVWATKLPDTWGLMANADAIPSNFSEFMELPRWSHMAVCYRAAAKALRKHGEQRDGAKARAYDAIANDYIGLLKGHVSNRSGEYLVAMGSRGMRGTRRPKPWDQLVED
jgi:hypothetical protein